MIGVSAADARGSDTLTVSPVFIRATAAFDGLQVKPVRITYTGDGSGFLGGENARDLHSGIDWTKWTAELALGTGVNQLDDCEPDCAGGTFHGHRVRIELWRPRTLSGTLVFTRMTIFYEGTRPAGESSHYTFTDVYIAGTGGGYGWGPPSEEGYCKNTYGEPPAAGCGNIHTLP
jgi:hypothetical protein